MRVPGAQLYCLFVYIMPRKRKGTATNCFYKEQMPEEEEKGRVGLRVV